MRLQSPSYNDFLWDTANPKMRDELILKDQLIPTILYAKERVPFYRKHFARFSEQDIRGMGSLDELVATLPHITKEHLATNHPMAFVPEIEGAEIDPHRGRYFRFGTGGTTSKPVMVIHSMADWRAMTVSANRHIEFDFYCDPAIRAQFAFEEGPINVTGIDARRTPLFGARILGAYNADHITNNIYASMLLALGTDFYFRPSLSPDAKDIYELAQSFQANGLLAPPEGANNKKGAFLADILAHDSRSTGAWRLSHRYNSEFNFIFWSSMPISDSLYEHLKSRKAMPYIKGHFGSTEACPTASTCSAHPRQFHLTYGPSVVLIKSMDRNELAAPNEFGYTLVSKIGATNRAGQNIAPTGAIYLNYMTGDGARLSTNGALCACGRNTPLLYDIARVEFQKGKALHGCQIG